MTVGGYVASPRVVDAETCWLYGDTSSPAVPYLWRVKGPIRVSQATQFPGKLVIGDFGKADNPILSNYTVSDLRGGMGLYRYTDVNSQLDRFWSSISMDTLIPYGAVLGPSDQLGTAHGSANNSAGVITSLAGTVIAMHGAEIWNWTSAGGWAGATATTPIDTLPAVPVANPTWFATRMYYPLGASGYSYQAAANTVATDVAAGASDPAARHFAIWDNKLYAIDTSFRLWSSTTGNAASWTGLASIPLEWDVDNPRAHLVVYVDAGGDPALWVITHVGPWTYDAVNDKWFRSQFQFPYNRLATNYQMGVPFGETLMVQTSALDMAKLTMGQSLTVDAKAGPNKPDGSETTAGYQTDGTIINMVADDNILYVLVKLTVTASLSRTGIFSYNGRGWHHIWTTDNSYSNSLTPKGIAIVANSDGRYLWFNNYDNNNTKYVWSRINIAPLRTDPAFRGTSQVYEAASAPNVTLPWFDAGYESQKKTAINVRVKISGLSGTGSVSVYRGLDYSTTLTQIGSTLTVNTNSSTGITIGDLTSGSGEVMIHFPGTSNTNNIGAEFKSIRLAFNITRASATSTATPRVEYVALDFYRNPDKLKGFLMQLDCRGDAPDGRSPRQQVEDLWNIIGTTTLGTFAYRDDTGNTRSYLCKVMRPEGIEDTGPEEGGLYTMFVHTFSANDGSAE